MKIKTISDHPGLVGAVLDRAAHRAARHRVLVNLWILLFPVIGSLCLWALVWASAAYALDRIREHARSRTTSMQEARR